MNPVRGALAMVGLVAACTGSGSLTHDQVNRACTLLDACEALSFVDPISTCERLDPTVLRCALAAGSDCTAVNACIGVKFGGTCTSAIAHCEGTFAVDCGPMGAFGIDCSHFDNAVSGSTCIPTDGGPACSSGTCTMNGNTCQGSVLTHCQAGIAYSADCARDVTRPLTCGMGTLGVPACIGVGPPCMSTRCEGTTLVGCVGGFESRVDCSTGFPGRSCWPNGATHVCGYGDGTGCGTTAVCSGNSLTSCIQGVSVTIDCTTLGFRTCGDNPNRINVDAPPYQSCIH